MQRADVVVFVMLVGVSASVVIVIMSEVDSGYVRLVRASDRVIIRAFPLVN